MVANQEFEIIKSLIGKDVTEENLKCVDKYICENMGIFIPSIGFCKYAIKPNHTHPSYSFIILFDENPALFQSSIKIKNNQCLLGCLSPNIPHEEKITDTFNRYIALFIDSNFFNNCLSQYSSVQLPQLYWEQYSMDLKFLFYINKFMSEYEDNQNAKAEMLKSLSFIITNEIIRCILNKNSYSSLTPSSTINIVCNHMEQHFNNKITVNDLAQLCNVSPSNLNQLFKKEMHISPIEYLINLRLRKSKKYLRETNDSITDIAIKCGFYSASHFSSCFSKQFGLSPSQYKKIFNP